MTSSGGSRTSKIPGGRGLIPKGSISGPGRGDTWAML